MPKRSSKTRSSKSSTHPPDLRLDQLSSQSTATVLGHIMWRVERLERQVRTLSELVRDHAEDADRLVRIVAEDREVLRRELLQEHHDSLKKRLRRQTASEP
ncbi:MAG: hypothetical protein ACREI3_04530 [Nitrospirales bacterium]